MPSSPRPRILFVKQYNYTRITGGAEEQIRLLSTEFARRGWEPHSITESPHPGPVKVIDGVTMHSLPEQPMFSDGNRGALRKLMADYPPDVVYNRGFDIYTAMAMLDAPKGAVRVWASANEGDGRAWLKLDEMRKKYGLLRVIRHYRKWNGVYSQAEKGVRQAEIVVAQRQEQVEALKALGYSPVLIRNTQKFTDEPLAQPDRTTPVILWAASVKKWKGPLDFIDLARRCRDLPAQFLMIGEVQEEPFHAILKAAVSELPNFRYDGLIPLDRVGEYFRRAYLFISTSISEGYPTTFIKAWQQGVPVISLHNVNPEHLITEKGFGVLAGSLDEMEAAVRRLIRAPEQRDRMGAEAYTFARREYNLTTTVDKLEGLLRDRGVSVRRPE
jgi:glycosyltransferase involved in cell wall biosynthesis